MSTSDIELGPIDYLVVEWPPDKQPTGEAMPLLVDLVDRGLIRILDLAFVRKETDGTVVGLDFQDLDLDGNPDLAVFEGASSGLIGEDDYETRCSRCDCKPWHVAADYRCGTEPPREEVKR